MRTLHMCIISNCCVITASAFRTVFRAVPLALRQRSQTFRSITTESHVNFEYTPNKAVFCNVELNGGHLEAVGFDMDFTLVQVLFNLFHTIL